MAKGSGRTRGSVSAKEMQLAIINASNPMRDDYHTGIRSVSDILTFQEAVSAARRDGEEGGWNELSSYPDVTNKAIENALESGEITVYSSYPIQDGVFVSPSRMMASDYAGEGKVYSKRIRLEDVAWISTNEGQMATIKKRR